MKEKPKYFKYLTFVALAASGKSEVLTFLKKMPAEQRANLHLGPELVILDDFPYVDMMRQIDAGLTSVWESPVFFPDPRQCFIEPEISWKLLILLLNDDHHRIVWSREKELTEQAAFKLLAKIDAARKKLGAKPLFLNPDREPLIGRTKFSDLLEYLEKKAIQLLEMRNAQIPMTPAETTVLIEFARGAEYGAKMPLPYAYADSFSVLDPRILQGGAFLYLKVLPEQAALKNFLRADPTDPSSILGHCVPYEVMFKNYGSDDFEYLLNISANSGWPGGIKVKKGEFQEILVPAAILDNTGDLTTFVREHKEKDFTTLPEKEKDKLYHALKQACDRLWERYINWEGGRTI